MSDPFWIGWGLIFLPVVIVFTRLAISAIRAFAATPKRERNLALFMLGAMLLCQVIGIILVQKASHDHE